jgi:hypothetical protein
LCKNEFNHQKQEEKVTKEKFQRYFSLKQEKNIGGNLMAIEDLVKLEIEPKIRGSSLKKLVEF